MSKLWTIILTIGCAVAAAGLAAAADFDGSRNLLCAPTDLGAVRAALGSQILVVTPGVRPKSAAADDQRRVATPASAMSDGADFLVVGRPITKAANPATAYATIVKELSEA